MDEKQLDEWTKYQEEGSKKILEIDCFDTNNIKYVGGLDISFNKNDITDSCAYLTIISYDDGDIVYEDYEKVHLKIPYISGYLGFREIPVYKTILTRLKNRKPEYYPDILMVDGFGILHHRGFGSASHLGYEMDIATIGIGKTLLFMDGLDERIIKKEFKNRCFKKGQYIELIGESGKLYGAALKSSEETTNPIYVSVGHKISLETSIKIVNNLCKYRIPEPIRISDIRSKIYLNKN